MDEFEGEVVRLRGLAHSDPDGYAAQLAFALNNLSSRLSELDRPAESFAACQESVAIFQSVANDPDSHHGSATAYRNLALAYSDLDRYQEALAAITESVRIRRSLTATDPDLYRSSLGESLVNLSMILSAIGRPHDARAAIDEAVELHRWFDNGEADSWEELADSLHSQAILLDELHEFQSAIEAAEECAAIRRELLIEEVIDPEDLAAVLFTLASLYDEVGAAKQSTKVFKEGKKLAPWMTSKGS